MRLHTPHAALSMLITALVGLFALSGCADDITPGCDDDGDCHFGRQCVSGVCLGNVEEDRGGDDGGDNNATSDAGADDTADASIPNPDPTAPPCDADGTATCPPNSICLNGTCTTLCSNAEDCPEGRVCAPSEEGNLSSATVCVLPWPCSARTRARGDFLDHCFIDYECDDYIAVIDCESSRDGTGCTCLLNGRSVGFSVENGSCVLDDAPILDAANLACGTRFPVDR